MTESTAPDPGAVHPLLAVTLEEKAVLARSFGSAAEHYARYRPGPSPEAVDWMLGDPAVRALGTVVDLGAGTGALTRLLVERADEVVGVEPDDEMRAVLAAQVPEARALSGRGEEIPLPDGCADAVTASSSWHWMDPEQAVAEVARVLGPGGTLGVVWSGPDPEGPFLAQAQAVLRARAGPSAGDGEGDGEGDADSGDLGGVLATVTKRPEFALEIPDGAPFGPVEHTTFAWDRAMDEDELIGLLGTMSWIITMDDEPRERMLAEARTVLRAHLEAEGAATIEVAFKAAAWRSRRSG